MFRGPDYAVICMSKNPTITLRVHALNTSVLKLNTETNLVS